MLPFSGMAQWDPTPPLDIPLVVTAGFGEIRAQHFHSGLDFSTGGRQQPVFAVESGEIYRIRTSAVGYGKAIYIRHQNGMASVYAHLARFEPEIEAYIRAIQMRSKRFEQDTLLMPGTFKVSKGQMIAYSGNTGSSTAPHLHFELRDLRSENVLNPLEHGIKVKDVTAPDIRAVALIPLKDLGKVNNAENMIQLPLTFNRKAKKKVLPSKTKIPLVSGWVGFGFKGGDVIGKAKSLSGIYEIEVEVDSVKVYHARFDRFSFAETRCVNGYVDYPSRIKSRAIIQRCLVPSNNMIGVYKASLNRGYFYFNSSKVYKVVYKLKDYAGNITIQEIKVKGAEPTFTQIGNQKIKPNHRLVFSGEEQSLAIDGFEAEFWKECLFDTSNIQLLQRPVKGAYTPEVAFGSMYIPINQPVLIRLQPAGYSDALKQKLIIVRRVGEKEVSLGGYWQGTWLSANTTEFGDFRVVADTTAPQIRYVKTTKKTKKPAKKNKRKNGKRSSPVKVSVGPPVYPPASGTARFRLSDNYAGYFDVQAWLNGEWILLEPDEAGKVYTYRFADHLEQGVYCIRISATDGSVNTGTFELEFEIPPRTSR